MSRYLKDMTLPTMYQDEFLHLCLPTSLGSNEGEEMSPSDWSTDHKFNNIVSAASPDGKISLPNMYANRDIVPSDLVESIHKYGSIKIWSTTLGLNCNQEGYGEAKF